MKKHIAVMAAILLFTVAAVAQDVPKVETFLGYTYTRANSASDVPAFSANGGSGQFVANFGRWLSGVADVGAVYNGNIGGYHLNSTFTNYLFGPRVSIRKSRVTPYFQMLFGGVYLSTSARVEIPAGTPTNPIVIPPPFNPVVNPLEGAPPPTNGTSSGPIVLRATHQQNSFAMTLGGGLDIKITRWVSFRPIGLDWYMTRLQNLRSGNDNNQHNIRYTTGFNFMFGAQ